MTSTPLGHWEMTSWPKISPGHIMQVCGGNAGLLHQVAVAVKAEKESQGGDTCTWNFDAGE